jgi:hypothetical protein
LDVATVFAQVNRDAVSAGQLAKAGGDDGVGIDGVALLAQRSDMVNVD